ncbi:hypothetical protein [Kitasatospora sp. NPDC090091]|uniref:hypothetical protein n=1 Tax=Kitasatospora sp. NPDC090091 TaxID=3364081 RepID=UPI00382DAB1F
MEEESKELLFRLLDNPDLWRERAVEQIELTDELWSDRERVIDVKPFTEVAATRDHNGDPKPEAIEIGRILEGLEERNDGAGRGRFAEVLLPITSLPKMPILAFEVKVDGNPIHRVPRDANGDLQARYFAHLARRAGYRAPISEMLLLLLSCIFSFSSSTWRDFEHDSRRPHSLIARFFKGNLETYDPVYDYIQRRQGSDKKIDAAMYARWQRISGEIRDRVVLRHVTPNVRSAAENPLLAIPKLCRRLPKLQEDDTTQEDYITAVLMDLRDVLRFAQGELQADPLNLHSPAYKLVSTYASYGRRWEAVAKCRIPLDRPLKISVKDRRMMDFHSPEHHSLFSRKIEDRRSVAHYQISFADAVSNHLHITIPDQHVQFKPRRCRARDNTWNHLSPQVAGSPDDEQKTRESYSRYDTKPRVDQIWIELHLCQIWVRSSATIGVALATAAALVLLIHFAWGFLWWHYDPNARLNGADVVAILLPVTVAASLALARESSTLGMRVKSNKQYVLMAALGALWVVTVIAYFQDRIAIDTLHQAHAQAAAQYQLLLAARPSGSACNTTSLVLRCLTRS